MIHETKPDYPQTIAEAIGRLLDLMKPEDTEKIRQLQEYDLISLLFGLSMYIRNNFGMWKNQNNMQICKAAHRDLGWSQMAIEKIHISTQ